MLRKELDCEKLLHKTYELSDNPPLFTLIKQFQSYKAIKPEAPRSLSSLNCHTVAKIKFTLQKFELAMGLNSTSKFG